jgi:hypothetical protein
LGRVPAGKIRLRLSLFDGNDGVEVHTRLRALVYTGRGDDIVTAGGSRVYGGDASDELRGRRLYGGRGRDRLKGVSVRGTGVLFGGAGQDVLYLEDDHRGDVVRVRGGGVDHVHCPAHPDPDDALFVDRTDRLSPSCKKATVLYTGRPRYPYP